MLRAGLVVAFALLLTAPAAARVVAPVRGELTESGYVAEGDVALSGQGAIYTSYGRGGLPEVRALSADGAVRRLGGFEGPLRRRGTAHDVDVAASASTLVVVHRYPTTRDDIAGYRVGSPRGRGGPWVRCRTDIGEVVASGTAFSYVGCDEPGAVFVRDRAAPGAGPRRFTGPEGWTVERTGLAGDYVAVFSSPPESVGGKPLLTVFNWRTGAVIHQLSGSLEDFALQADGKVVVAESLGSPTSPDCGGPNGLSWYSPAEPGRAHPLPQRSCDGRGLAMARDRIVYSRSSYPTSTLWMTDLSGRTHLRLTDGPWWLVQPNPFAFDGERIAYVTGDCSRERVILDTVGSIAANGPGRQPVCPIRFAAPVRQRADGRVEITVECPRSCRGQWWVDVPGREAPLLEGDGFGVRAGAPKTLVSDRSLIRAGRRPQRRRLRVYVSAAQPNGTERSASRDATLRATLGE
jgi:hypothetical protein